MLSVNLPFSTIGNQEQLSQGAPPDSYTFQKGLHSQVLLTAFLMNDGFRQVTENLPDMVKMLFDEQLFAHTTDKENTQDVNFLEGLIQHQTGASGDNMLGRFTADLQLIAQDSGLSLTNNNITKALIAFAMQKYDNELETGAGAGTQLFSSGDGLLDWYIQAGSQAMVATAGNERAFMLGGSGNDILTGCPTDKRNICLPNKKLLIIPIGSATIGCQHHEGVGKDWLVDDEQWRLAA